MSIDDRLYDAIESNNNIVDKVWFNNNLQFAKQIYNTYNVDYNFENILDIIKNLKITSGNEEQNIFYDENNNRIVIGNNRDNMNFDLCKVFLQLTSQSYDEENKRYNRGIITYNEDGTINKETEEFNNHLISKIITYNTGYSINDNDTSKQIELDEKLKLVTDKVGYKDLVTCFAYGQGNLLYLKINSEEQKIKM